MSPFLWFTNRDPRLWVPRSRVGIQPALPRKGLGCASPQFSCMPAVFCLRATPDSCPKTLLFESVFTHALLQIQMESEPFSLKHWESVHSTMANVCGCVSTALKPCWANEGDLTGPPKGKSLLASGQD